MRFKNLKTVLLAFTLSAAAAAVQGMSCVPEVMAASSETSSDSTAGQSDAGIIDESKTGSLTIHKYDITAAEAAGDFDAGSIKATGERDSGLEETLEGYAIAGVQFTLMRVGNMETCSVRSGSASSVELVYEIPEELAEILGLSADDAVDMTADAVSAKCENTEKYGLYHYTGRQISDALETILESSNVTARNSLENYVYDYGTLDDTSDGKELLSAFSMELTDEHGVTSVDGLELGLYLAVETEVPEQVTETVNPFLVQIPFTGTSVTSDSDDPAYSGADGGAAWVYDMVVYPKNQTGNPTLDKSVRSVYSYDGEYRDTTTASGGDILDFILVSKLPHISTAATYLSEYTFADTLSAGLTCNGDVKIAFYDNADDAGANNTDNAAAIWTVTADSSGQGYASVSVTNSGDGATELVISMTEAGLGLINGAYTASGEENAPAEQAGLSDYYMTVYYTATVNSDESAVLGDEGNPNSVSLKWSRTADASAYYNVLTDRNYVYIYALDLTKEFSDGNGDFDQVQFQLYNSADGYYVVARQESGGVYYVTGRTADEKAATVFVPNSGSGNLVINGLEADTYALTEIATDDGYNLLKEPVSIRITPADRDIIASVSGVTGLTSENADQLIRYYNYGIYDENGNLINEQSTDLEDIPYSSDEEVNGRTINGTDLYVGTVVSASATVDGSASVMAASGTSEQAAVVLTVRNTKSFLLPQTGGNGLYLITILGVIAAAGGIWLVTRRKKAEQAA